MIKKHKLIIFAAGAALFLLLSCKNNLGEIPVESIRLLSDKTELSLVRQTIKKITVQIIPEEATNKTLIYSSTRGDIASIDNTGLITAKEEGHTVITIKASDGVKKTINVTVVREAISVTDIEIKPVPESLLIGDTYKLKAEVKPDDATDKGLTYTADNDKVFVSNDGTVTAQSAGTVNITVKSKSNSEITKTVAITIKQKPEIKLDVKAQNIDSNSVHTTFKVETLNGKLDYTPVVVGGGSKWLSFSHKENTNESIDTVHLNVSKNKTVWERTAYIKFTDADGKYIKITGSNGRPTDLEVKFTQKKNENPNVTIKWVYGITPPADGKKDRVEIQGSNPTEYCEIPYVFYWYETEHTKFFNTRKMHPTGSPNGGRPDNNQCWAKTSSNMLHWWFEQNESNIKNYIEKKGITEASNAELYKMYKPVYTRGLDDKQENIKSSIANEFRTKCNNGTQGSYIRNGLQWYLFGLEKFADNPNYSPELFKDVFGKEDGKNPIETRGSYTKREFNEILKKALAPDSKKAVGLNLHGDANYAHAITLWGAAFDEEENVIAIYVVDNNFQPNRIFTYGIHYLHDIYAEPNENYPHLINYANNYYDKKKHVGEITTLDKGEAQWKTWLEANK